MPRAKGVIRIDTDSTHGWQVRVYRDGKTYTRMFSDSQFGGRSSAFDEAKRYRAELVEEVAQMPTKPRERRLVRRSKGNATGVVGVSRTYKRDRKGVRHEVYSVSWSPEPGVSRGTSFSIKRYGSDTAFRLACQLRWKKMKEIYGDRYDVDSYLELYRQKAAVDARAAARRRDEEGD